MVKMGPNPWDLVPKVTAKGPYSFDTDDAPEFRYVSRDLGPARPTFRAGPPPILPR